MDFDLENQDTNDNTIQYGSQPRGQNDSSDVLDSTFRVPASPNNKENEDDEEEVIRSSPELYEKQLSM
jgi:hypothetical protein